MADDAAERIAVLQMVAAGKVSPEEGLELLAALDPPEAAAAAAAPAGAARVPAGRPGSAGPILRVHCQMDEVECDFSIPAEVAGEIADMLPPDLKEHVPQGMLLRLPRLAGWHKAGEDLLRYQNDDFELVVRREGD